MTINKLLTKVNFQNTNNTGRIKYIVIHYVGATGGAKANCDYFYSTYRGASAHYFVGHSGEVWQCVDDADVAWHCGASSYKHKYCRNSNSIGIELCCRKNSSGNWYFENATVNSAIELTKMLMKKYGVPASNVIRHYDVTGKVCPEPFVRDGNAWNSFKNKLTSGATSNSGNTSTATGTFKSYLVKITASVLNVRAGAGVGYKINTTVKKNEVYTIVGEKKVGTATWGKLKSGAGWIHLGYTKRV